MKLIDLLVKELPKRGGFPKGANECVQDVDGTIKFFDSDGLFFGGKHGWCGHPRGVFYCTKEDKIIGLDLSCDHSSAIITRTQYESALAASEGWIEWEGGECPVDTSEIIDIKFRDGEIETDKALGWRWHHDNNCADIIAYRLHQPDINSRANDDRLEQDLNECIGQDVDMPEWNGDGFPPAGCKCEVMESNPLSVFDKWTSCTVIYFNLREGRETQVCIIDDNGDFAILYGNDGVKFRPLRTEEKKAREKLAASLHIAAGASPIELNGIGPLYFELADAIISGSVFGTTFKADK